MFICFINENIQYIKSKISLEALNSMSKMILQKIAFRFHFNLKAGTILFILVLLFAAFLFYQYFRKKVLLRKGKNTNYFVVLKILGINIVLASIMF